MSEEFRQDLIRWLIRMDVNVACSDQVTSPEVSDRAMIEIVVPTVVRRACDEISDDIRSGLVSPAVGGFAELHEFVDANGYGGAFSWPERSDDTMDPQYVEAHCLFWNHVQDGVDAWLRAGRPDIPTYQS